MTRVPALAPTSAAPEAQIDAAVSVLIRLLAAQAARELAASALAEEDHVDDEQAED
jgi:hypothetical protein